MAKRARSANLPQAIDGSHDVSFINSPLSYSPYGGEGQQFLHAMAPSSVCTACRKVIGQRFRQHLRTKASRPSNPAILKTSAYSRSISTTRYLLANQTDSKPFASKTSSPTSTDASQPPRPVLPEDTTPPASLDPVYGLAKGLRERATSFTETYVAYGVCEKLVQECARQADYTIPQAHEKGVEIPKTKDGEDLGVGTGWWFESECPTSNT